MDNKLVNEQIADNKRDQGIIAAIILGLFLLRSFDLLEGKYFISGINYSMLYLIIGTVGKQVINKDTIGKITKNLGK